MKNRSRPSQQQGYLVIIAVLLIVVVGFIGTVASYMFVGTTDAINNFQQSEAALFIAEGGLEEAARKVLTPFLTGSNLRIACGSITGNASLTNTSLGAGTFTATTVSGSPVYVNTTLSGALTNSATTIPVSSTSGFSSAGRIMIDLEVINYGGISGNSFIGVQRGVNHTYSTSHANSAPVAQYQCNIDSQGGVPNLTSPLYQRELQEGVPLQEAWIVGARSGSNFELSRWNRPTEITWTDSSFTDSTNRSNLNGVSFLSNAQGWAVGDIRSSNITIIRWLDSSWTATPIAGACTGQDLFGVSAVSSQEAWAVGGRYRPDCAKSGNFRYDILQWNGTSWTLLTPSSSPSIPADSATLENLNAVHVIGTAGNPTGNLGFAVGDSGTILKFNGTQWQSMTSGTTQDLTGVYVVSSSEAWAVGTNGVILRWNGSTWSSVTSPTTTRLNSIYMLDETQSGAATSGWAVGNNGVAITYNGTSWSSQNTGSTRNLLGVAMFNNPNDVWAVGAAGTAIHWDGSAWTTISSDLSVALNAIAVIPPQQYPFAWKEISP